MSMMFSHLNEADNSAPPTFFFFFFPFYLCPKIKPEKKN